MLPNATVSTEARYRSFSSSFPSSATWCTSSLKCSRFISVVFLNRHASQVTIFARNMGFWALESVFAVFSERIRGGSHADITDLTKIKHVSAKRARALFSSGFTTIESVAAADANLLSKCLRCKAGMQPGGIARDIIIHAKRLVVSRLRECQGDAARMQRLVMPQ